MRCGLAGRDVHMSSGNKNDVDWMKKAKGKMPSFESAISRHRRGYESLEANPVNIRTMPAKCEGLRESIDLGALLCSCVKSCRQVLSR